MDDDVIPIDGMSEPDPAAAALESIVKEIRELRNEVHDAKASGPTLPNGRVRDTVLGLASALILFLAGWLWVTHADIAVLKSRQDDLRSSINRIHPGR